MPNQAAPPAFTPRDLRNALGLFPTGVAVVTAAPGPGLHLGTTVSSFNSVSLDPPLILFSLARNARSIAAWNALDNFAVNVLGEHQSQLSTRFAKTDTDKWDGVVSTPGLFTGAPVLRDAVVVFECRVWARYDGGDHIILVGRVLSFERAPTPYAHPLVFSNGQYRKLNRPDDALPSAALDHLVHGW